MTRRTRLVAAALLAGLAAGPGAAPAAAQDDCGGADYCLPAPPATAKQKQQAKKAVQRSLGTTATLRGQIGSALVFDLTRQAAARRPARKPITLLAVVCPRLCTVEATPTVPIGRRGVRFAPSTGRLKRNEVLPVRIDPSGRQRAAIAEAPGTTASVAVAVDDAYGPRTDTVRVRVRLRG